ncbi:hypothetical protein [Vibrio crassostreae]|uniref:hypothetical protein n=1 Tax=Vibrio crassostreae TaxID=246167 RepID=UPI001405357A|nr:hypothetical protein [Vibrio crassostreae]
MTNTLPVEVVENIGVDCFSRCPYCNAKVNENAVVLKHLKTKQLSVAHQECTDEMALGN